MKVYSSDRIKKLKGHIFSYTDVVEIDFMFQHLADKKFENDFVELVSSNFLDELELVLKTGPMWKFNPTCLKNFIKDNTFKYDRKILEKSVLDKGRITFQEVDRNLSLFSLCYTIEMLIINIQDVSDELITKSDFAIVRSLGVEVEI
jgi:hypothetical protein